MDQNLSNVFNIPCKILQIFHFKQFSYFLLLFHSQLIQSKKNLHNAF